MLLSSTYNSSSGNELILADYDRNAELFYAAELFWAAELIEFLLLELILLFLNDTLEAILNFLSRSLSRSLDEDTALGGI